MLSSVKDLCGVGAPKTLLSFSTLGTVTQTMEIVVTKEWREARGLTTENVFHAGLTSRIVDFASRDIECKTCKSVASIWLQSGQNPEPKSDGKVERYSLLIRARCRHPETVSRNRKAVLLSVIGGCEVHSTSFSLASTRRGPRPKNREESDSSDSTMVAVTPKNETPSPPPSQPVAPVGNNAISRSALEIPDVLCSVPSCLAPKFAVLVRVYHFDMDVHQLEGLLRTFCKELTDFVPGFVTLRQSLIPTTTRMVAEAVDPSLPTLSASPCTFSFIVSVFTSQSALESGDILFADHALRHGIASRFRILHDVRSAI